MATTLFAGVQVGDSCEEGTRLEYVVLCGLCREVGSNRMNESPAGLTDFSLGRRFRNDQLLHGSRRGRRRCIGSGRSGSRPAVVVVVMVLRVGLSEL